MVLIIYSTRGGATAELARQIQKSLGDQNIKADIADVKRLPDLSGYNSFVLGAGIRAGGIAGAMKSFCLKNLDLLTGRPLYLYVSSLARGEKAREYIDSNFPPRLLAHARHAAALGGRIRLEELGSITRFILKKVANIDENRENFDPEAMKELIDRMVSDSQA